MKYKQMLDQNMVPEWRNQYLDYKELDNALNKAVESKFIKSREKGIDAYFELIKFNQKFAKFFSRECQKQLDKIDSFHKEKLLEIEGKYKNLQDQLDQVLSSALYRHVQPDIADQKQDPNAYSSIVSITDLFKNIKHKISSRTSSNYNQADSSLNVPSSHGTEVRKLSVATIFGDHPTANLTKEKVSGVARKLSEGILTTGSKLSNNLHLLPIPGLPPKRTRRISQTSTLDGSQSIDIDQENGHSSKSQDDLHHLQAMTGGTSLSKKKIIACYRKKMTQLKFAFRELYFNLVLFEQYTQLNYTGFEEILRKHDRIFASTIGRKFYQEHVQTADFHNNLPVIDNLIEGVEHVFTLHFENGNRRKAIEKLQVPTEVYKPFSPKLDFRVGYELGLFSVLFILVIVVGFVSDTGYDWRTVFSLYRSPLILIIFLFQSAISIVIWKHYKINHVLIFELDPRNNLSFHHFLEFGSILGIIWCLSVLLFLFSQPLNILPSICPLVVIIIIAAYLFNPIATGHHQSRFWFFRILGRIFTAPLHPVKFADFWIADQLVSIVPLFLDLEYLSCFYTTDEVMSVSHLSVDFENRCVTRKPQDLVIRTIVAALPAWFRCAQCLRRWRDENWLTIHLANAGKYACMVSVIVLSAISQYNKSSFEFDTMRIIWMVAAIFTSCLTAYWDIIYDFGLFNTYDKGDDAKDTEITRRSTKSSMNSKCSKIDEFYIKTKKTKNYPFLRKELVYPVWVYYFAIVEDWILRFGWIITMSLTEFSNIEAELMVSLLAPMEMFRRFVWNCIRLENEQLNNCGLFRAVRDIPIEVFAPIDESHLDKVIMMMDSKDGPSMRSRLMKRRTLRPDKVSFIVLHQPDDLANPATRRSDVRMC